jgi:hypothetical protein
VTREQIIAFLEEAKDPVDRNGLLRVLLDECIDRRLGRELAVHEAKTARQMEWTTLKNGELLALASVNGRGSTLRLSGSQKPLHHNA